MDLENSIASLTNNLFLPTGSLYLLTRRERQVFDLARRGLSGNEMSDILGIKLKTVKFHLGSIYRKCKVKNKYELQRVARTNI